MLRQTLLLGPEDHQAAQELVKVDDVRQFRVVRDVDEEHLSEEVVLYSEHFGEVLLEGLQGDALFALALFRRQVPPQLLQVDCAEGVEEAKDVGQELFVHFAFELAEGLVVHIESLNVVLGVHEFLDRLNEVTASHVVDEVEHDQRDPELELDLVHELVFFEEGPGGPVLLLVFLRDLVFPLRNLVFLRDIVA